MATLQQLGTVRLRLRLGGKDYQETLHAVQGDTGRVLEFDVLDGDGTVVTDLTGVTPVLFVRRPDGKEVGSATGEIVGGVIRITIPSSLLAYAGYATAQIQLVDSANQHKLHDHLYRLQIEESLEAGASPGENLWFSLAELTEDFTQHKLDYATQSEFKTTNLVANGDFSNSTTGWIIDRVGCNVTALNNTLFITGNGAMSSEPRTYNRTNIQIVSGNKYYIKALAKITNNNCDYMSLQVMGSVTGIRRTVKSISAPIENVEYEMSGVYTIMDTGELRVGLAHKYIDIATSNGKTLEARYVFAMDLTETFGAGNEPTADEMDLLMEKYPNSWFITANLLTFKESYLELSSKIKAINNSLQVLTPSVGFIDNPLQSEFNNQAMVTLSYDDGFLNNYNLALPLHEKYGIPATFNIITSNITSSKFMNAEKILNCHHRGIEIASHSHTHNSQFPLKTDDDLHFECVESKRILGEIIGVSNVETIAIPYSQYDNRVKGIVSQYFKGIRVYSSISNSIPPADRYHLHSAIAVGNTTTFEQVKTVIDYAITNNRWSIIMLHGINNGTKDQYEISQRLLDEILRYIAMQGRDRLLPVSTKDGLKLSLGDTY